MRPDPAPQPPAPRGDGASPRLRAVSVGVALFPRGAALPTRRSPWLMPSFYLAGPICLLLLVGIRVYRAVALLHAALRPRRSVVAFRSRK